MNTKNSINESLEIIRRALEDETNDTKIEQGSKLSTGQSVQVKFF